MENIYEKENQLREASQNYYAYYNYVFEKLNLFKNKPKKLVILIGGYGGSGKGTFIQELDNRLHTVHELSTIDPVRRLAEHTIDVMRSSGIPISRRENIEKSYQEKKEKKTDDYRQFLYDLKQAWIKFNEGPNVITYSELEHLLKNCLSTIVFVNMREPEEFEKWKVMVRDMGYPVCTMEVRGSHRDNNYKNTAETITTTYDYDFVVNNTGDMEQLELNAKAFLRAFSKSIWNKDDEEE